MKRDKHKHHINTAASSTSHSPAASPDGSSAHQQFFGNDRQPSISSGVKQGSGSSVSTLYHSMGPSAYFSHDLLLGIASVFAFFLHGSQHYVLYIWRLDVMNLPVYLASVLILSYVLFGRLYNQQKYFPKATEDQPSASTANTAADPSDEVIAKVVPLVKQTWEQHRFLVLTNVFSVLLFASSFATNTYLIDEWSLFNWFVLFAILDGSTWYHWLQSHQHRSSKPSSLPSASDAHVLPRLPSIDKVDVAGETDSSTSLSNENIRMPSSSNAEDNVITLYCFAMKPWMSALSIVYLVAIAPWVGSRMRDSLHLIYLHSDCLLVLLLAVINIVVFVVVHHLQRNRLVFSLYLKHLSHKINVQRKKGESVSLLLTLSQPYIDFLLSWFDLETSVVAVFGQQVSPSFLTALLMLLVSAIVLTLIIISDASNRIVLVSGFCLMIDTASFLALLLTLMTDFKHQVKEHTNHHPLGANPKNRKWFKNVYDMDALSSKYALLQKYCEQYEQSTIHSAEVSRAIGQDDGAGSAAMGSPVVFQHSKHRATPTAEMRKASAVDTNSQQTQKSNVKDGKKKENVRRNSS